MWFVNFKDDATEIEVFRTCEMDLEVKNRGVTPTLLGEN